MKMLNEQVSNQLKEVFDDLQGDVTLALFTDGKDCQTCSETRSYMNELSDLNHHIHFVEYNIHSDQKEATEYSVQMVPSIVLLDSNNQYRGVKFNGIPAGHEINSFIPAIVEHSGTESELPTDYIERIQSIDKDVNIKVFVTLGCPHCPGAVQKAQKLALMNDHIDAEMVEAQTFAALSQKFSVSGVPKIIINDQHEIVGNQPLDAFLEQIESL